MGIFVARLRVRRLVIKLKEQRAVMGVLCGYPTCRGIVGAIGVTRVGGDLKGSFVPLPGFVPSAVDGSGDKGYIDTIKHEGVVLVDIAKSFVIWKLSPHAQAKIQRGWPPKASRHGDSIPFVELPTMVRCPRCDRVSLVGRGLVKEVVEKVRVPLDNSEKAM